MILSQNSILVYTIENLFQEWFLRILNTCKLQLVSGAVNPSHKRAFPIEKNPTTPISLLIKYFNQGEHIIFAYLSEKQSVYRLSFCIDEF
jgi:hypothetical protein